MVILLLLSSLLICSVQTKSLFPAFKVVLIVKLRVSFSKLSLCKNLDQS